jgi:hypothetical protein
MCNKCRPPVTRAYFIDDKGVERDAREISQIIDEVFFPPPTPEQAKAAQEYFEAVEKQPTENITVIDIPPSKGPWPFD